MILIYHTYFYCLKMKDIFLLHYAHYDFTTRRSSDSILYTNNVAWILCTYNTIFDLNNVCMTEERGEASLSSSRRLAGFMMMYMMKQRCYCIGMKYKKNPQNCMFPMAQLRENKLRSFSYFSAYSQLRFILRSEK